MKTTSRKITSYLLAVFMLLATISSLAYIPTGYSEENAPKQISPEVTRAIAIEEALLVKDTFSYAGDNSRYYYSSKQYIDGYAGKFRDDNGTMHLLFTPNDENSLSKIAPLAKEAGYVIDTTAKYTLNELNVALDTVTDYIINQSQNNTNEMIVGRAYVDIPKNELAVYIVDKNDLKEELFREKVLTHPALTFYNLEEVSKSTYNPGYYNNDRTISVGVRNRDTGTAGFLTAGHYLSTPNWYKDISGNTMGRILADPIMWCDVCFVTSYNSTVSNTTPDNYYFQDYGYPELYDPVRIFAGAQGISRNVTVQAVGQTELVDNWYTLTNAFTIDFTNQDGDSGSPVVYDNEHFCGQAVAVNVANQITFCTTGTNIMDATNSRLR